MPGPTLYDVQDAAWVSHLAAAKVSAWYCSIPGAAPRGYSTQDKASGPSDGDRVVLKASICERAQQAARDFQAGKLGLTAAAQDWRAYVQAWDALDVALHEFSHCKVRLTPDGDDRPEDVPIYSHPGDARGGIQHAIQRGFPINAFTGLLRLQHSPQDVLREGVAWLATATSTRLP